MNKLLFPLLILALCWTTLVLGQSSDRIRYINKYKKIAVEEMERAGIPASIKLAQALLESGAGASDLAVYANNHFGIKCGPDWKGKEYFKEDDDYDEAGELISSCFRVFKNSEASFIAHTEFLRDPKKHYRYGFLFLLNPRDYKKWAKGLKHSGYATSPTYDQKLIRIIETYELYKFDELSSIEIEIEDDLVFDDDELIPDGDRRREGLEKSLFERVINVNDTKMIFANGEESLTDIGFEYEVRPKKLLKFNEKLTNSRSFLPSFTRVYLQKKRNNFRGTKSWHYVKEDETMFEIAQIYGLRLDKLYKKNRMEEGKQPAKGERIILKGKVKKGERPKYRSEAAKEAEQKRKLEEEKRKKEEQEKKKREKEEKKKAKETEEMTPPKKKETEKPKEDVTPPKKEDPFDDDWLEDDKTEKEKKPEKEDKTPPAKEENNTPKKEETEKPKDEVTPPKKDDQPKEQKPVYHVVQKGETLYRLRVKYGTPVEEIKKMNGLTSNLISVGQRLRVK